MKHIVILLLIVSLTFAGCSDRPPTSERQPLIKTGAAITGCITTLYLDADKLAEGYFICDEKHYLQIEENSELSNIPLGDILQSVEAELYAVTHQYKDADNIFGSWKDQEADLTQPMISGDWYVLEFSSTTNVYLQYPQTNPIVFAENEKSSLLLSGEAPKIEFNKAPPANPLRDVDLSFLYTLGVDYEHFESYGPVRGPSLYIENEKMRFMEIKESGVDVFDSLGVISRNPGEDAHIGLSGQRSSIGLYGERYSRIDLEGTDSAFISLYGSEMSSISFGHRLRIDDDYSQRPPSWWMGSERDNGYFEIGPYRGIGIILLRDGKMIIETSSDDKSNTLAVKGEAAIDKGITIDSLSGEGNAYACLDSEGKLFRSQNPCVQ